MHDGRGLSAQHKPAGLKNEHQTSVGKYCRSQEERDDWMTRQGQGSEELARVDVRRKTR